MWVCVGMGEGVHVCAGVGFVGVVPLAHRHAHTHAHSWAHSTHIHPYHARNARTHIHTHTHTHRLELAFNGVGFYQENPEPKYGKGMGQCLRENVGT